MKKAFVVLLLMTGSYTTIAQDENTDEETKRGFKKENLFVGGDITLAFSNVYTAVGGSPYFGYSLNKYVDAAISTNFIYTSQRDYFYGGDKLNLIQYGPGAFVRVYPLKFLYGQVQYEHNFINYKYFPPSGPGYYPPGFTDKSDANSLLVGGGYAGGRQGKGSSYFYISVMWDVGGARNSPYLDGYGRAIPIFRAGYHIALFQGNKYDY